MVDYITDKRAIVQKNKPNVFVELQYIKRKYCICIIYHREGQKVFVQNDIFALNQLFWGNFYCFLS